MTLPDIDTQVYSLIFDEPIETCECCGIRPGTMEYSYTTHEVYAVCPTCAAMLDRQAS